MRALVVGMVSVGLVLGLLIGRTSERARRNYKDWGAAKTALPKARKLAMKDLSRAAGTILVVGAVMVVLFIGAVSAGK